MTPVKLHFVAWELQSVSHDEGKNFAKGESQEPWLGTLTLLVGLRRVEERQRSLAAGGRLRVRALLAR